MTSSLFASFVNCNRALAPAILSLCCLGASQAEPLSKLPPGYASKQVGFRRNSQGSVRSAVYEPATPSRHLEAAMTQLAANDERQDLRLRSLEKDVGYLGKITAPASHPGTYRPPAPPAPTQFHTVRAGETLWRIASKHRVSINDIRTANRMTGDTVRVGQALLIPGSEPASGSAPAPAGTVPPSVYVVKAGDTFSRIAQAHAVSQRALAQANPTVRPERILIGARLTIPGKQPATPPAEASPRAVPPSEPAAAGGATHIVRVGESLGAIAKSFGVPTASVAAANRLKNPNHLVAGQRLVIPPRESVLQTPATPPTPAAPAPEVPAVRLQAVQSIASIAATGGDSGPTAAKAPAESSAPADSNLSPAAALPEVEAPMSKPASMPVGQHRGVLAYRIERGDTIDTIANMFSTTPGKIREMNNLAETAALNPGDELVVPALAPVSLN